MRSSEEAAAEAGVVIRELRELEEFERVHRLFDDIWHPAPSNAPVTMELMIGFAQTGNYVAGAFAGDELVGASVGFLASGNALHSHVTGAVTGKGIGYALKLHQREWSLERGLERITWTFDPLVRRNARFNLVKLGARPEEYLRDFYGVMADAINEGDTSDRLLAVWHLEQGGAGASGAAMSSSATAQDPALARGSAGTTQDPALKHGGAGTTQDPALVHGGAGTAGRKGPRGMRGVVSAVESGVSGRVDVGVEVWEGGDGWPVRTGEAGGAPLGDDLALGRDRRGLRGGRGWLVGTPRDVERLRREDPEAAKAWRMVVREALGGAMEAGGSVVGFTDEGEYVVVVN